MIAISFCVWVECEIGCDSTRKPISNHNAIRRNRDMSDEIVFEPIPTYKRFNDLSDQEFDRIKVVGYAGLRPVGHTGRQNGAHWWCVCSCRPERIFLLYAHCLTHFSNRSCGCLHSDATREQFTTHGESYSDEYTAIARAIQRCENENNPQYYLYGESGISVFPEWKNNIKAFVQHIGRKPSKRHSLDRFPNQNGNYEPGNVRWATPKQQVRNRRITRMMTYEGRTQSIGDWADETGISYQILITRKMRGFTDNECLTTPIGAQRKKPTRDTDLASQ